jgi:hypothetical protein
MDFNQVDIKRIFLQLLEGEYLGHISRHREQCFLRFFGTHLKGHEIAIEFELNEKQARDIRESLNLYLDELEATKDE